MKRITSIIAASCILFLIPFVFVSGQEKKSEQRIKIVIANDGGSDVILDTLITGKPLNDSIVLKDGKTIYLVHDDKDEVAGAPGCKKYVITTTSSDEGDSKKEIKKEIMIVSSDSDMTAEKGNEKNSQLSWVQADGKSYSYTVEEDTRAGDSEKTKYVIARDGITITVEGSDYAKVKELTREIEKTLDTM
jgi:hypothetical protein